MRNWKSGRICNYLMKGLLLCALVVGGWFTAGIGAKAESLTHSVEFKSEESQIVQFKRADGLEQHIEVTNNTQRPMKVTFSHNVPIRNYNTELRIGGHEVASRMATAVKDANVLYLYPCQWVEKACEVKFTTSAPAYTDITISAEYIDQKIGFKEDEIGLTKDTAYEIPLSGHPYSLYEGLTGTGTDERGSKASTSSYKVKAVCEKNTKITKTSKAKKPVASKYKRQGWINPNINAITPYATATFVPWEMSYYNGKVTVTGYVVNNRIFKLKTYKVKVGVGVDNKIYASTTKTYKNVKDSTIKKVKFSFKSKKALDFVNNSPTWSVRTLKSVW